MNDEDNDMARLEILKIGHPSLAKTSARIEAIDDEIRRLAEDMIETMYAAPGIGLSAPQVNVNRRLITIDLSVGEQASDLIVMINPEIVFREGKVVREEGCLSVPEIYEKVTRPQKVRVKGLDLTGLERTIEAQDSLARAFCHEIDHLDGKLFVDTLSPLKRKLIRKKFKKKDETVEF
jgi:peptide deformylase